MRLQHNDAFPGVGIGYAVPAPRLRPYVSTVSYICVEREAGVIQDVIYPEWGNIRFAVGGTMALRTGVGALEDCTPAGGIGPTSHATRFALSPGRFWSISLTPLGWSRFIGVSAQRLAEKWLPVSSDTAFARFEGLRPLLEDEDPDAAVEALDAHLEALLTECPPVDEERIIAAHAALVDPTLQNVGDFAVRLCMSERTLGRFSASAFGFSPILLLRRQRFLRSMALYMLDPSLSWIETLDNHYYDQAHFIRDFKRFMDMTPSQYARMPHPVMWSAARARSSTAGAAMQVLQAPE